MVGKTFRMIEWDLQGSPREPDGAMVRVTMPLQLTRNGMRHAIAKAYDLETAKSVKQFAQTFAFNGKIFYERLESKGAVTNVPDGTVLVWTQVWMSALLLLVVVLTSNCCCQSHTVGLLGAGYTILWGRSGPSAPETLSLCGNLTSVHLKFGRL